MPNGLHISKLFDPKDLQAAVAEGLVNATLHPTGKLVIYNYGPKAQFEDAWTPVTMQCRGLIVNTATSEVVARPFRKFFNLNTERFPETKLENLPADIEPEVTAKLDGSLGILYPDPESDLPAIATRGSFTSDQAIWATRWYRKNYHAAKWPDNYCPLFEIVYPENRIVCAYDW